MFDKWIKGDRDSEEFSVSGIFWILLDTGRFKAFARFVVNQHGIFSGINREQGRA